MTTASTAELPRVSVEHITLDERGNARIAGSRIKVQHVAELMQVHAYTAEQLQSEAYPHLNLAQIYSALAYYHDHKPEIDQRIKDDNQLADREREKQQSDPAHQELIARLKTRAAAR